MQRGKAAGLDDLSTEHLLYCHPLLLVSWRNYLICSYAVVMFRYNSVRATWCGGVA